MGVRVAVLAGGVWLAVAVCGLAGGGHGVTLRGGPEPTLVNASGKPFVAKGVVYYQPGASHHYFLEGLDLERIPADLEVLKAVGFNTLFVEASWGELVAETDPNQGYRPIRLHKDRLAKLRTLARRAREAGFYLYVSTGASCVPPEVPAKEYPAVTDATGREYAAFKGYYVYNWLADEAVNRGFLAYLGVLGAALRSFDHVIAYSFSFETMDLCLPWAREDPLVTERWRAYLRDRNPDIGFWNARWSQAFTAFEEVGLPWRDWPLWAGYYKGKGMAPRESGPVAWKDFYDFRMVATLRDGRYGLSFKAMADALRAGDPDALTLWKPYDPLRYCWEMGCLAECKAGNVPEDVAAVLDAVYHYPGLDLIAFGAYPVVPEDPAVRAEELAFTRHFERAKALQQACRLPLYCQEYGINHHEWSQEERVVYLENAITALERLGVLGHNLWQSHDYYGTNIQDQIQPNFGLHDLQGRPYPAVEAVRRLLDPAPAPQ